MVVWGIEVRQLTNQLCLLLMSKYVLLGSSVACCAARLCASCVGSGSLRVSRLFKRSARNLVRCAICNGQRATGAATGGQSADLHDDCCSMAKPEARRSPQPESHTVWCAFSNMLSPLASPRFLVAPRRSSRLVPAPVSRPRPMFF